ncbi:MAG: thiamine-phosphate kinase [Crocinitomicaceae bacterium]|nr:thiamine-phosphate kinase [Crocinitomicaceae bacterium]|tara:strand:+ start:1230 stop:2261 length:1032 start_codon:yes stop_codon:yes gene_type:complete
MERTEIQDLGEFGLIGRLTEGIQKRQPSTLLGVGDDAAVIDPLGKRVVVSTDLLVEGVHFDLSYVPLKHLGYKAVIANLSDICAMNSLPTQIVVGLGISNRFSVEALEELYSGMKLACELYEVDLVGGDTTSSPSGLTLSITAIGLADAEKLVSRSGANAGDLLVVSGDLGSAYMGLQVLEREKSVFKDAPSIQPELDDHAYILERQLKPEARTDIVRELSDLEVKPTSMIDVSDGLASECMHLMAASGLGVRLYEDKFPIDPKTYDTAREFNLDPTVCMLSGGEDYELLFTISPDDYEKLRNHPKLSFIGHMTENPDERIMVTKSGTDVELKAQGWDGIKQG